VIWQLAEGGEPVAGGQHPPAAASQSSEQQLASVRQVFASGSAKLDTLHDPSGAEMVHALMPVTCEGRVTSVIEAERSGSIHPRLDAARVSQLLEVIAELAATFQRRADLTASGDELKWRTQLDQFALAVHQSLDPFTTAHTIVNDGRVLLDCDRLSLLKRRGRAYRLVTVSGQSEVHRRSNVVRALEKLTAAALAAGERMSYPDQRNDLPPQVESALDHYCDLSAATRIEVIALAGSDTPAGALIAENFTSEAPDAQLGPRLERVAAHASTAWMRAVEHRSVFLLPVWAAIGRLWPRGAAAWAGWLTAAVLVIAAAVALCTIPADFEIAAEGTLQPAVQRHVFASSNGVIAELTVREGDRVEQGGLLATIENPELALKVEQISGELQTTEKKLASLKVARISEESSQDVDPVRLNQLAAEESELKVWLASLQRQLALLREEQQRQSLRRPIAGTVITWNVEEQLKARPVREGQRLMTVADLEGDWTLELDLPAQRAGHVATAAAAAEAPLPVTFVLATNPEESYHGELLQMAEIAQQNDTGQAVIRTTVLIDAASLRDRRPGAVASAKIDCGQRSVGYVWFRDLIEFVQLKVLFRFQ